MKRRRHRNKGAFGGQNKKKKSATIQFDITAREFDGSAPIEYWFHSAPDFSKRLERLDWCDQWATIWNKLLVR
jgi:hypothetical protein